MRSLSAILLTMFLALSATGCGTFGEQAKVEGLRAAKCLAGCAISCGTAGAVGASQCQEYNSDALKAEALKAAQCLSACAIQCGVRSVAALQAPASE